MKLFAVVEKNSVLGEGKTFSGIFLTLEKAQKCLSKKVSFAKKIGMDWEYEIEEMQA